MYQNVVKRVFDILLCSFALIVLSPLFLVAAIGIKLSSPGSVFYYSDRMGKDGKPFHFYKFRSMHNTDNNKHMCVADAERLFPFGKLIRRTKIDELPQLINVIKGDMSVVGPRPMTLASKMYTGEYAEVMNVRPGLTSPASLYDYIVGDTYTDNNAYKEEVYPVKQKLELYYVRNISFAYDLNLVFRTMGLILAVAFGKKKFADIPELKKVNINKQHEACETGDIDFSKVRVLLTDGGARQSLTMLHGLKDIGCHVTVLCSSKNDVCYNSKLPDKKILNYDAAGSYDGFEDAVLELVATGDYDVLFPVAEITTNKVTIHEDEIKKYVKIACAPRESYIQAFNKQNTFEKAMDIGIPCPYTRRNNQSVEDYLSHAKFPIIIKPRQGLGSIGFHKFETEEEFREALDNKTFEPDEYVIQEFVEFDNRIGTYVVMDKAGDAKMSMAQDVLRWYPLDAGTAVLVQSVDAPEAIQYSKDLLKALGWKGFANCGFMIEKGTGKPKLLEINGRITANIKVSWLCGFNIARQLIEMAFDEPITEYPDNTKFGMKTRHFQADVLWFLKSPDRFRCEPSWFSWKDTQDLVYWKGDIKPFVTYTFQKVLRYREDMSKRKH